MSDDWLPEGWISGEELRKRDSDTQFTNYHGTICLDGEEPEQFMRVSDIPPRLQNRC